MPLQVGQQVKVNEDAPFGMEVFLKEVGDTFYCPAEGADFKGKIVTIAAARSWKRKADGEYIYYYRIEEDGNSYNWLDAWFTPIDIKDIYLIQLVDGRFLVIPRNNLGEAVFIPSFADLGDEVKNNCSIFTRKDKSKNG